VGHLAVRSLLVAVVALPLFFGLGTSAQSSDAPAPEHPDQIIVRRFATPRHIVALDPSLGFSLDRGKPGVPRARRAASIARATAFIVADTITHELRDLGYHAVQSDEGGAEPDGRFLVVSGVFRNINEGHRRGAAAKDASIAVSVEIDIQIHDARPQRIAVFRLDTRQIPHQNSTQRNSGVSSVATRLAVTIAHTVAELAHRKN